MEKETQKKKDKIQVGVVSHFQRDKRGRIMFETAVSEPIYRDWTPELQKAQDDMLKNFAKMIYEEMKSILQMVEIYLNLIQKKVKSILNNIDRNRLMNKSERRNSKVLKTKWLMKN